MKRTYWTENENEHLHNLARSSSFEDGYYPSNYPNKFAAYAWDLNVNHHKGKKVRNAKSVARNPNSKSKKLIKDYGVDKKILFPEALPIVDKVIKTKPLKVKTSKDTKEVTLIESSKVINKLADSEKKFEKASKEIKESILPYDHNIEFSNIESKNNDEIVKVLKDINTCSHSQDHEMKVYLNANQEIIGNDLISKDISENKKIKVEIPNVEYIINDLKDKEKPRQLENQYTPWKKFKKWVSTLCKSK